MKKVVAVIGSPRKLETYKMVQLFEQKLESIEPVEFEYIMLREMNLEPCMGCFACLSWIGRAAGCVIN